MASLNHIGIAVKDLPRLKRLFSLLGLEISHVETVQEEGVTTHFLPLPKEQGSLELLDPLHENSTVAKFLQKHGPGIHHLSFLVSSGELDPLCKELAKEGFRLIYEQPRKGAHGMRVNFLHPATCDGILIEVMEPG